MYTSLTKDVRTPADSRTEGPQSLAVAISKHQPCCHLSMLCHSEAQSGRAIPSFYQDHALSVVAGGVTLLPPSQSFKRWTEASRFPPVQLSIHITLVLGHHQPTSFALDDVCTILSLHLPSYTPRPVAGSLQHLVFANRHCTAGAIPLRTIVRVFHDVTLFGAQKLT